MPINDRRTLQRHAAQDSRVEPKFRSSPFLHALSRIELYAANPSIPILLEGESGTGKSRLARVIHERSPRAAGPFHCVTLSAVDDTLASAELFGHVVGAYTDAHGSRPGAFASANGGTLFLDEIGKASLVMQNRLLHAVEALSIQPVGSDRTVRVDARIVAATSVPLAALVSAGRFLDDLYARIEGFRIHIPPLRERRADIPVLVHDIVLHRARQFGYARVPAVDGELMAVLQSAPWPHNVRQLDATIQRMLLEARGAERLTLAHCADELGDVRPKRPNGPGLTVPSVSQAMSASNNNKSAAARSLSVARSTLIRFLRDRDMRDRDRRDRGA